MQSNLFIGNVAVPVVLNSGTNSVAKVLLIGNEYMGKDKVTGESKYRTVSLRFTAFGHDAENLAKHVGVGDQLIVKYRIENNDYEDKAGEKVYGYNFIVQEYQYGKPANEKKG